MEIDRAQIFAEAELPDAENIIADGKMQARNWQVVPGAFLKNTGFDCEADYKRSMSAKGHIMRHAHMGFRDVGQSCDALARIFETCEGRGAKIDRFGITLDWSMGYTRANRKGRMQGTGLVLAGPDEFVAVASAAPAAPHFGDFMLGFPASLENTKYALAAGSTAIGNLGQYFTFRLPGDEDDIASTTATLSALFLIATQDVEVLVHSNLDDGFAAVFVDLSSVLGAALVEKYIVEELIGAPLVHCYGHHFTDPLRRLAFHFALKSVSSHPGTMVYGNTVAYRGTHAENYASLASYLSVDIAAQLLQPSGHAVNPVPVSENERIPDVSEIIDAQCFAAQMIDHARGHISLLDIGEAKKLSGTIVNGAQAFKTNLLKGFDDAGIDITNPFEMLLAMRRLGGRRLEQLFSVGKDSLSFVPSPLSEDLEEICALHLNRVSANDRAALAHLNMRILTATSDVHEHGKMLLERAMENLGVNIIDGGVSIDADVLAARACEIKPDAIALSTYNGVALTYVQALKAELDKFGLDMPVLVGGRLNQIPEGSNTSLPVDVSAKLLSHGVIICDEIEDAVPALLKIGETK